MLVKCCWVHARDTGLTLRTIARLQRRAMLWGLSAARDHTRDAGPMLRTIARLQRHVTPEAVPWAVGSSHVWTNQMAHMAVFVLGSAESRKGMEAG